MGVYGEPSPTYLDVRSTPTRDGIAVVYSLIGTPCSPWRVGLRTVKEGEGEEVVVGC